MSLKDKLALKSPVDHTHGAEGEGGASLDTIYPIGCIYISTVETNPADIFEMGTWEAFGAGKTLVGLDDAQAEFDVVEESGGAKTVTLTEAQIPAHTHVQNAHNHTQDSHNHTQDAHGHTVTDSGHTHTTQRYPTATGGSSGFTIDTSMSGTPADNTLATKSAVTGLTVNNSTATNQAATATNQAVTAVNQNAGGGGAHNNLQPYIVVYFWKRTA